MNLQNWYTKLLSILSLVEVKNNEIYITYNELL